ncbi:MAG: alpha/beta hydrolase [Burkholderiales bacterium]|nr:alpha/beta hydrolase [Anaerolineae bacterium]
MPTSYDLNIEGHKLVALGFNENKGGTPVVFIHGLFSSVNFWTNWQTPYVNEHLCWYSLSLPGHYPALYPTGFRRENLTVEMLTRVISSAIQQLVAEQPVILVGYSIGATIALNIAATLPQMTTASASISGFAFGEWVTVAHLAEWLVEEGGGRTTLIQTEMERILEFLVGIHELPRNIWPDIADLNFAAMMHYLDLIADIDIRANLPQINAPTLIIAGERDVIVLPDHAAFIAAQIPHSKLMMLPNASHLPMGENPPAYHAAVSEWLQSLDNPTDV